MKPLFFSLACVLVLASCAAACPLGECYAQPVFAAPPVLAPQVVQPAYGYAAPAVAVQSFGYGASALRVRSFSVGYGVQQFAAPVVRQNVFIRQGFRSGFGGRSRFSLSIRQRGFGGGRAAVIIRR